MRALESVDPGSESNEEQREGETDTDSDEEGDSGDGPLEISDEESDVDVDGPRVVQWVDEEDLEQPENLSGDPLHRQMGDPEDIVRFSPCLSELRTEHYSTFYP